MPGPSRQLTQSAASHSSTLAAPDNRNKTDLLDAAIIADFVCALKPAAWQPPTLRSGAATGLGAPS